MPARLSKLVLLLLPLAVLLILPLVASGSYSRHVMIIALIWAVVASNWDLTLGYGGVFNFAHLAFFAIGLYVCAILAKTYELSPWLAMLLGGLGAVLAAIVVTMPVLRLKGIYVILVTFAFSQLVLQIILSQSDVTGGSRGIVMLPPLAIAGYSFASDGRLAYYYSALAIAGISTLYLRWLVGSSFGTSIVALRDNEDYAISRGVSLSRQRLLTIAASAFFPGLAGAFYGIYLRVASPEIFGFGTLSFVLSMLLIGGTGTIYGPIIAAFALSLLNEAMAEYGPWRYVVIAVLIVATLLFYPAGMLSGIQALARRVWRSKARAD